MNARTLISRDAALAALFGLSGNADMGHEAAFGYEFGGYDFGQDTPPAPVGTAPTANQALSLWHETQDAKRTEQSRMRMLDPNGNSRVKVEQYIFPISQAVVIGTATVLNMTNQPDVTIRPQRALMNSPTVGFATISEMRLANVAVTVGGGSSFDSFFVSCLAEGVRMDLPTITPSNRATITGTTTTLVPVGYVLAAAFTFSVAFIGPAKMAG